MSELIARFYDNVQKFGSEDRIAPVEGLYQQQ